MSPSAQGLDGPSAAKLEKQDTVDGYGKNEQEIKQWSRMTELA